MAPTQGKLTHTLETPRLCLRHHKSEDLETYLEAEQTVYPEPPPWL